MRPFAYVCTTKAADCVLLADAKLFNNCTVALDVLLLKVGKKVAPVSDHFQQPTAAVVVFFVDFEMLIQRVYTSCQNRNLHLSEFCRSG